MKRPVVVRALDRFLDARLKLSAIPPKAAQYAGIRSMTVVQARAEGYELPGYPSDGFLIPYYNAMGQPIKGIWRWRNSRVNTNCKYTQPAGTGCWVSFPRVKGLDWTRILANPRIPVFVVEGELKALSLSLAGVPAVGIGGVWNWLFHKELLPELRSLAAGEREILIAFDSDTEDKPQVAGARYHIAKALLDARAKPVIVIVPHLKHSASPDKTGVDDLIRVTKLQGDKLMEKLRAMQDAQQFALAHELYRLNAEYLINRATARVHRTDNIEQHWDDLKFCRVLENQPCSALTKTGKPTTIETGKAWIAWPQRNQVEGCVYQPLAQAALYVKVSGRRYLNTWTGWASEPEEDAEGIAKYWTPLLDHLFRATQDETLQQTEHRELCRRWFEMWWAYPVQHPGAKLHAVTAMIGHQGGGKSLVGTMVGWAVYGRHFQEIGQQQLESNFNASYMENKSLVMGSEITGRDFVVKRNVSEYLKLIITSENILVEQKYVPAYPVRNTINLYLTSNHADAFLLDDDDRRYFLWNIPDVKLGEALGAAWLKAALEYAQSSKGRAALHFHLLHLPIDAQIFQPQGHPPDTEAKQNAKEYSQNVAERWIAEFAASLAEKTGRDETVWRAEDLYVTFCRDVGNDKYKLPTFLKELRKRFCYLGQAKNMPVRTGGHWERKKIGLWVRKPEFNSDGRFPTLNAARYAWEQQYNNLTTPLGPLDEARAGAKKRAERAERI